MKNKASKIIIIAVCVAALCFAAVGCSDAPDGEQTCVHVEVVDPALAPTCLQTGLTEGKHCEKCGTVLVEQKSVLTVGHDYVDGICSVCGEQEPIKLEDMFIFTELEDGSVCESIGDYAFENCTHLKDVYCLGTEAEWAAIVIVQGNAPLQSATMHYSKG